MRRVRIIERAGETYTYAAVDRETGEVPLQLADRTALVALCERLGWAVHEKKRAGPRDARQRTNERHRSHPRRRVGGSSKYTSARKRQRDHTSGAASAARR